MKKKVNIYTQMPIVVLKYPIAGSIMNIDLDVEEIAKCICAKAKVDEVLPSGKTIRLDLSNYNKDNNPKPVKPEPVNESPKVVEEEKNPEPVNESPKVVEEEVVEIKEEASVEEKKEEHKKEEKKDKKKK